MSKILRFIIAVLMLFSLTTFAFAQDDEAGDPLEDELITDVDRIYSADPDPIAVGEVTSDATIEAITDSSMDYYNTIVTIEGTLSNFVGTRIFEVSEDELLTDSIVLVVNNSNEPLPEMLVEGALVQVTGRVHPSFDEFNEQDEYIFDAYDIDGNTGVETGIERLNMVSFVHNGYVPEEFGEHTIVEVLNVQNVILLGYDDLLTVD